MSQVFPHIPCIPGLREVALTCSIEVILTKKTTPPQWTGSSFEFIGVVPRLGGVAA